MTDSNHVVIVGGRFAGLGCARKLAKRDDIQVTLIDKHNYHQFQPLLYQVATCQLASSDVATSLRKQFRKHAKVAVKLDEVTAVDRAAKQVTLASGIDGGSLLDPPWVDRQGESPVPDDAESPRGRETSRLELGGGLTGGRC